MDQTKNQIQDSPKVSVCVCMLTMKGNTLFRKNNEGLLKI